MSQALHEQFIHALERSQTPVIVLRHDANIDDFSSALSVRALMDRMQRKTDIISTGGPLPKQLQFLECNTEICGTLPHLRRTIVKIKTEKAPIHELTYSEVDGTLHIQLTPQSGMWKPEDFQIDTEGYRYDLIILIGARDLNAVGPLFEQYADFFHDTPIINIDHSPENEHYGQINIVDINSTSCAEVCFELFERTDSAAVSESMATCLLTGMIHKTKSFRAPQVTPKTLRVAGQLVAKGANREAVVEHLYKTKSVAALRLWGRALSRLKSNTEHHLIWTMLTKQDFAATESGAEDLHSIVDDILSSTPESQIVVILFERGKGIEAFVYTERPHDALTLVSGFASSGTHDQAHVHLVEDDIVLAESQLITHIEDRLKKPAMPL